MVTTAISSLFGWTIIVISPLKGFLNLIPYFFENTILFASTLLDLLIM